MKTSKIKKYLRLFKKRTKRDLPGILILYVTSKCNQKCEHCYYSAELNQPTDLKLSDYEGISRELNTIDTLLIGGGEPFTNKELPEILGYFYKYNKTRVFSIPSNFTLYDRIESSLKKIREQCPDARVNLNISFDGLEETHNEIRKFKNAFETSMNNCEKIAEQYKNDPKVTMTVASTVMDKNINEIEELGDYVNKRFKGQIPIAYGYLRGEPKDPSVKLPAYEELRKLHYNSLKNRKGAGSLIEVKLETLRTQSQVVDCRAGELMGVIYADGSVSSCELLERIGKINETNSFSDIWGSKARENQRKSICNKECHCTHECFIHPSTVYSRKILELPYYFIKHTIKKVLYNIKS